MIFFRTLRKQRDTAIAIGTACMARYVAETEALRAELREAREENARLRGELARERMARVNAENELGVALLCNERLGKKLARYTAPRARDSRGHYLPLGDA